MDIGPAQSYMLKLTRKADYGLIALKHMASKSGSASAREISDTYGIPLPLLSKVLQKLARNGFVTSEHGALGGYRLRRDASKITTLEVIRSIDGPIFLTSCFTEAHECGLAGKCNVREPLRKVHEEIQRLLENISIADMCDEEDAVAGCGPGSLKLEALISVGPAA
ncbi:MAG: Rrf2 family transcriptional regulator [Bryobacteraceae bacterium]|nr:Rrf2 family transcriptional regulator [Bryobacteraceae bacterium]